MLADLHAELIFADEILLDDASMLVRVLDDDELAGTIGNGGAGKAENQNGGESVFHHGGVFLRLGGD